MELSCIRHSLIPGTSKLFEDYLYNFDRVSSFYRYYFSDPASFAESAKQIRFSDAQRRGIVSALRRQNGDSAALAKLAESGTVAVVTGQQVGFCSGPAYTIFKALTAVRLAASLSEQGIPAVPVFWLATEDHDLAEVDHVWMFDQEATPRRISVAGTVVNGGPVGKVKFNEIPVAELREALGELPFAEEVMERLEQAYHCGATFGSAFKAFLQDLLKDFGLLFLDPLPSDVREIAAPFLSDVVERVPELLGALRQRNKELETAGYHSQVHIDDDTSLLFLLEKGKRIPIRWKDGKFSTRERSYDAAGLQRMADKLSPNALLRPVMQDFLLPTVSYIGGPSEIAYLAQGQVLYEQLLGRMPVIFPRNSFTLLGARGAKLLDRFSLGVPDFLDCQEHVKSRMAARLVPAGLRDELAELQTSVTSAIEKVQTALGNFDITLEAAAKKSTAKIQYQIGKLSERTAREILRRDERAGKAFAYLSNLIYPNGHLQERFYSIVPFLAEHGWDLPRRLFQQTQLACPDHMVRTL